MPLLEALMIDLGGSIAKALLTRWMSSNTIVSDASSSMVDVLQNSITDRLAQQRARRQFETIGEKVGESLLPIFRMEGVSLDEGSRTAIALAVAETLKTATPSLLVHHDLEPVEIAQQLLAAHPARSHHFSDTEGRLYERIVGECCRYIVDIASQLPQFTERTFAEILTRERYLVEIADRIVKDIARLRAQLNPQVKADRFELDYRLTIIRKLDELELFGSGMSVTARKYSLSLAYVSLSLEHEILQPVHEEQDKIDMAAAMLKDKPQLVRTVADFASVLAESPYLLLRGDAGSGKTTLMQWIAVQSASQTWPQVLTTWNDTIPFFIRLRQHVRFDQDGEPGWPAPESFPGLVAPAIAGAMPPGWVHRQLQEGRALVLVDGIDEVPAPLRPGVYAWLGDLITTYPESRFIVTARPYAASKEDLPVRERLKEAQVLPMTPSAIDEFILQWHQAVAANVQDLQEKQELQEIADHLIAKINTKTNHTLQHLARNPLLCAMLCALSRERHQQLPSSRIALYDACCELLIERRDRERRISLTDYPAAALSYEQKSLLLSHLAYWLIRNGQTEEAIETIDERLKYRLSKMVGVPQDLQGSDARRLFIERSGILREPVKGAIDFTHRTFQEFLAAKAIVDEDDISLLVANSHNDQWREVVLLTVGLAPRAMRERLVERLLKRAEARKRSRSQLYLLAAACTQVAREEMKQEIYSRIERGLAELVPLKSVEEVEAMAVAGTIAIPYLASRLEYDAEIAAACVRTLLQIGVEASLNVLQSYTNDDTSSVTRELIMGLRLASDKPTYAQQLLSHIKNVAATPSMLSLLLFVPHITTLRLLSISQVTDLTFLEHLPALTSLSLDSLPEMTDLTFLERLPALTSLSLGRLPKATDFTFLERLPVLTNLSLNHLPKVTDFTFLERLPALTSLSLGRLPEATDLTFLERLPARTNLSLNHLPKVTDLTVLERLPALTSLSLDSLPKATDFTFLERLPALTSLSLYNLPKVTDLTFLERLPALTSLSLDDLPKVTDLTFLEHLPALTSLSLYGLPEVTDLTFLERLPVLTNLVLYYLPKVTDLTFLERLNKLEHIRIGGLASKCILPQGILERVRISR